MANRFTQALRLLFKAPNQDAKRDVVATIPLSDSGTSAGYGAGTPLPIYPLTTYANGKPASRAFDFPPGVNLSNKTDAFRETTYRVLRWFANNHLITRAAVNVRKKEIVGLGWDIVAKDDNVKVSENRLAEIRGFWESPDRRDDFGQWLNRLLEDVFVTDTFCLEKRLTRNGEFYGLDVIDGTTIKIILDDSGRIPLEGPAYQQIIRGQARVEFTAQELIYNPYNNTSYSPYGKAFLESALLEVNTTLRALETMLGYFTDGNIPAGFINAPEATSPENIAKFQKMLNELLANPAAKSQLFVLPAGSEYQAAKESDFVGYTELYNFITENILIAFEVQPQEVGITLNVNKATGEQQENITYRRSLKPVIEYLERIFYKVNRDDLGAPEVAFRFTGIEHEDELIQAQVDQIYSAGRAIKTVNEIRADLNLPPLEGGDNLEPPAPTTPALFAYPAADIEKELAVWERKAVSDLAIGRAKRAFVSDVLPSELCAEIETALASTRDEIAVREVFVAIKKKFQDGTSGSAPSSFLKRMSLPSKRFSRISTPRGRPAYSRRSA